MVGLPQLDVLDDSERSSTGDIDAGKVDGIAMAVPHSSVNVTLNQPTPANSMFTSGQEVRCPPF
jgi:hypothetical protein